MYLQTLDARYFVSHQKKFYQKYLITICINKKNYEDIPISAMNRNLG